MSEATVRIEVAFALPHKQKLLALEVPVGTTMADAVGLSGIAQLFEDEFPDKPAMGLWGKAVANPAGHVMQAGERIEIYRPLIADPKLNRKKRAQQAAKK